MTKTKHDADAAARQMLAAIPGINLDEGGIVAPPAPATAVDSDVHVAPEGVDPHTMVVADIVFDPALLAAYPDLSSGSVRSTAGKVIFDLYKSPPRTNKDRNRLLHDRVGAFVNQVHRERTTSVPHVKEAVRAAKPQRDLLALLAQHGITSVDDLAGLLGGGE